MRGCEVTPQMQQLTAKRNKLASEIRLNRLLLPWKQEIVKGYRLGMETADTEALPILIQALRTNYILTAKDVLSVDIRQYKQEEETPDQTALKSISGTLFLMYSARVSAVSRSVTNTAGNWVKRTSIVASEQGLNEYEAQLVLNNYITGQANTLIITESEWTVESARRVSVLRVKEPIKDSINKISAFFESGQYNEGRKLARQVAKLARLPLSVSEGQAVRDIAALRSSAVGPLQQAERLANARARAEEFDRDTKTWRTIGDSKVRDTHQVVDGQTKGIDEPFELPQGIVLHPGDGSLGAPYSEIINCRCTSVYN